MNHFFDSLHVTALLETGEVVLSVRVTDSRVDEYRLPVETLEGMVAAFGAHSPEWSGPAALLVRVDDSQQLMSLSVEVGVGVVSKREVHRLGVSQFEAMVAQFRAQVRG